ncbi:MAG: hypothetical protein ACTHLE_08340 [Agriterribacter sp.]
MHERKHEDDFKLPVEYKGTLYKLPSRLVQMGYSYKIYVQWFDVEIIFEPDEERNFRAVVERDDKQLITTGLLQAISDTLSNIR